MYPLVAALIALAIVMFMWRYLDGSPRPGRSDATDARPIVRSPRVRRAPSKPTAPDDDPEFLRELRQRISKQKAEDATDGTDEK